MAKSSSRAAMLTLTLLLSACGGGGGSSSPSAGVTPPASAYTVGGTVSGLAPGASITLYDKQTGETLALGSDGSFAFTTAQASGTNYAVTVSAPPTGQSCAVTDGLGVVGASNVTTIAVTCTTPHSIGGAISGLASGKQVTLIDNSRDSLVVSGVSGAGSVPFTFGSQLSGGQAYDVQIASQPSGAVCQVASGGSGTVSTTNGVDVTNVQVTCSTTPPPEYLYAATPNGFVGVSGYPINLSNGTLGAQIGQVGTQNYPVALAADSVGAYLYTIGGSGGADNVTALSIAASNGAIAIAAGSPVPTGIDPYGVAVSPNGNFVYVANNNDNTVSVYSSSGGTLRQVGLPVASGGNNPQGLVFNPAGTYLYVLNSGSDSITTFAADPGTGTLTPVGSPVATGVTPYGVQTSVTPGGTFLYVANYGSNSVSAYSLGSDGLPSPIAGSPFAAGSRPFAVTVNPAGTFAYVANEADNTVSTYSIDPTYGTLTPVGSPTPTGAGTKPEGVVVDPSGQYLYVSAYNTDAIEQFAINAGTGALTLVSATAATTPGNPRPLVAVRP